MTSPNAYGQPLLKLLSFNLFYPPSLYFLSRFGAYRQLGPGFLSRSPAPSNQYRTFETGRERIMAQISLRIRLPGFFPVSMRFTFLKLWIYLENKIVFKLFAWEGRPTYISPYAIK